MTFNNTVQMVREGGNASAYDVVAYGAQGTYWPTVPTADSTATIQAALSTGRPVDFVGLFYKANNLTQTADDQVLYSSLGVAHIMKNANGPLLTCSGNDVRIINLSFRGDAATPTYTGNNLTASGYNFLMLDIYSFS